MPDEVMKGKIEAAHVAIENELKVSRKDWKNEFKKDEKREFWLDSFIGVLASVGFIIKKIIILLVKPIPLSEETIDYLKDKAEMVCLLNQKGSGSWYGIMAMARLKANIYYQTNVIILSHPHHLLLLALILYYLI